MQARVIFLAALLTLTACSTYKDHGVKQVSGAQIDHEKINSLAERKLPKMDVIRELGTPDRIEKDANGNEVLVYKSTTQREGEKKVIGLTVKRDTQVLRETIRIALDKDGLVDKVTQEHNSVECSDIRKKDCE